MKKLILMGGDLASGKSTFSRSVGKKFGVTVINKDILKEKLGDRFVASCREENLNLSVAAFDIICYFIKVNEGNLIVESNFKEYEMSTLRALTDGYGYDVLSLKFKGKDKVLHERFLSRLDGNRHYVHKSEDFSDIKNFSEMLFRLRRVDYIGRVIDIDSTDFTYMTDEKLLSGIQSFLT